MKPPKAMSRSYHYKQENPLGLYPVEVIDIDLLRDTDNLMGGLAMVVWAHLPW